MRCESYLHVLRSEPGSEREDNHASKAARRAKIVSEFVLRKPPFACVVGKNLKTPKLNPMADDSITRGGIGSLVSLVYICDHPRALILKIVIAPCQEDRSIYS